MRPLPMAKPVNAQSGRRAIGHGALAERARTGIAEPRNISVRDAGSVRSHGIKWLEFNGLNLRFYAIPDGRGVPIKKAVAGIAMGLASDEKGNWKVLTDLQDVEDVGWNGFQNRWDCRGDYGDPDGYKDTGTLVGDCAENSGSSKNCSGRDPWFNGKSDC